jgi:hypothetical protein
MEHMSFHVEIQQLLNRHFFACLCRSQCISLGNYWNNIDFVLQPFEKFEVDLPQTMAIRWDEVQAAVDSTVDNTFPIQSALSIKKSGKL